MGNATTEILTCGRLIGRKMDGSVWSDHPEHGKLWFFDGSSSVCCAEEVAGDWKLGDKVRISLHLDEGEGTTPIPCRELCHISRAAESLYVDLTGDSDLEHVDSTELLFYSVEEV